MVFCERLISCFTNKMDLCQDPDMQRWKNIREMKIKMSKEDRRKEYKRGHVPIEDIPTWREQAKNMPDPEETPAYERLKKKCLFDVKFKEGLDLTDKICTYQGDITKLEIDAIVNAANSSLMGGGGVDGAIHKAAGPMLKKENLNHDGCPTGEAVLSGGYNLPARYVISTVGPQCENPRELASCYTSSLQIALDNQIRTVAFPCISTGIYGYPNDEAAMLALKTVRKFLEEHEKDFDRIIFCLFMEDDVELYNSFIPIIYPKGGVHQKKKVEKIEEFNEEDKENTQED